MKETDIFRDLKIISNIINNSKYEHLKKYEKKTELTLYEFSKVYFDIAKCIYKIIEKYFSDLKKLEDAHYEIIRLFNFFQAKPIEKLKNLDLINDAKENIRINREHLIVALNFFDNYIQNRKREKSERLSRIGNWTISIIAIIISLLTFIFNFSTQ
ncbi:MAG: hypothetical protein ACTSRG_24750 [Candidatus Helarchaeota archaeon]